MAEGRPDRGAGPGYGPAPGTVFARGFHVENVEEVRLNRIDLRRWIVVAVAQALWLSTEAVASSTPDHATTAAADRVLATMRSAVEGSPESRLRTASLGAEAAASRSMLGAGAPTLSWQREGIGSGFSRKPNSADYLRVSLPFNLPWQGGSREDVWEATERLLESGEASSRLEVATLAARRWLDLAAQSEIAALAGRRVERLERAVATQTRRYELGEISGFERTQLELELARARAASRQAEASWYAAEKQVSAIVAGHFPLPVEGDLTRLAAGTETAAVEGAKPEHLLAEAPALELAEIRSEVATVEVKSERRRVWGRPELELEWERIPDLGPESGYDAAGFRIGVPLPFGKAGRQRLLETELRAAAASAERDVLRRELSARVSSAIEAARGAEAALESLESTAGRLPTTEHSLAEQFRLGAVSYVVYLDGLARLDEVRRALIETNHSLLTARLDLARLLGSDAYFPIPDLKEEGS